MEQYIGFVPWSDALRTAFPGLFVLSVSALSSGVCLQAAVGLALFVFPHFVSSNAGWVCVDLFRCARKSPCLAAPSPAACLCWPKTSTSCTQKNKNKTMFEPARGCPTSKTRSETPALSPDPSVLHCIHSALLKTPQNSPHGRQSGETTEQWVQQMIGKGWSLHTLQPGHLLLSWGSCSYMTLRAEGNKPLNKKPIWEQDEWTLAGSFPLVY